MMFLELCCVERCCAPTVAERGIYAESLQTGLSTDRLIINTLSGQAHQLATQTIPAKSTGELAWIFCVAPIPRSAAVHCSLTFPSAANVQEAGLQRVAEDEVEPFQFAPGPVNQPALAAVVSLHRLPRHRTRMQRRTGSQEYQH